MRGKPTSGWRQTARRTRYGVFNEQQDKEWRTNEGWKITPEEYKRRKASGELRQDDSQTEAPVTIVEAPVQVQETDEQIEQKLTERFSILNDFAQAVASGAGRIRALFVSGPAGLGKSYTIEKCLQQADPDGDIHTIVKGYVRQTGLYTLLWQHRRPGQVLVFDDADSIFYDDVSLNMLKAASDTSDRRTVSYMAQNQLYDDREAVNIPKSFKFEGTLVFLTNIDFDREIAKNTRLSPHLKAIQSRAHYIDLGMKSTRDYVIRIRQALSDVLAEHPEKDRAGEIMSFIEENSHGLREMSLRTVLKIADNMAVSPDNWESISRITCVRNK